MNLNKKFQILPICDLFCAASSEYQGVIRLNDASRFIFEALKEDTTEAALLDALCERYDAPREVLESDMQEILAQLRQAELLEE